MTVKIRIMFWFFKLPPDINFESARKFIWVFKHAYGKPKWTFWPIHYVFNLHFVIQRKLMLTSNCMCPREGNKMFVKSPNGICTGQCEFHTFSRKFPPYTAKLPAGMGQRCTHRSTASMTPKSCQYDGHPGKCQKTGPVCSFFFIKPSTQICKRQ